MNCVGTDIYGRTRWLEEGYTVKAAEQRIHEKEYKKNIRRAARGKGNRKSDAQRRIREERHAEKGTERGMREEGHT